MRTPYAVNDQSINALFQALKKPESMNTHTTEPPQPQQAAQRTPPRTYVNTSTTGSYTGTPWQPVRSGGDDNQHYTSKGA